MRNSIIILVAIFMVGCTSGVEVVNQGDVYSSSGQYDCSPESSPCEYTASDAVDEWFYAYQRPGYVFVGWQRCPEAYDEYCHVQIDQATVAANHGQTYPPLVALFAPSDAIAVAVQSCTVGSALSWSEMCGPYAGNTLYLVMTNTNFQAVGWDNRVYAGEWSGNIFAGKAEGELLTAVFDGPKVTIALLPKGYQGCSLSAPNCYVSIVAGAL